MVLLECGLRVHELCEVPVDCLVSDAAGNRFLRSVPSKEGGERIFPLSQATARIIQEQQTLVQGMHGVHSLLFLDSVGQAISTHLLMKQLNRLVVEKNIRDSSGAIWRFRTAQLRATLARLLVEPHDLFEFLGHRSPDALPYYLHLRGAPCRHKNIPF